MAKTIIMEQLSEQCLYTFMSSLMANLLETIISHLTRNIEQWGNAYAHGPGQMKQPNIRTLITELQAPSLRKRCFE